MSSKKQLFSVQAIVDVILQKLKNGKRLSALGTVEGLVLLRLLRPRGRARSSRRRQFGELVRGLANEVGRRQEARRFTGRTRVATNRRDVVHVNVVDVVAFSFVLPQALKFLREVGLLAGDLLPGFSLGVEVGPVHVHLWSINDNLRLDSQQNKIHFVC